MLVPWPWAGFGTIETPGQHFSWGSSQSSINLSGTLVYELWAEGSAAGVFTDCRERAGFPAKTSLWLGCGSEEAVGRIVAINTTLGQGRSSNEAKKYPFW